MADLTGTAAITLPKITSSSAGVKYKLYPTSLSSDTELTADTYLMDANCDCNSYKLTFNCNDGNIVVKRSDDYYHTEQGAVDTTNSDSTHKVYWTVKNDDTIGTIIPGSTGSPAVLGGSWGNGTEKTNTALTMLWWVIKWVDNKIFINYTGTAILNFQNIVFSNCAMTSTYIVYLLTSNTSSIFRYIQYDSTSSITSTGTFGTLVSSVNSIVSHIKIASANSTGTGFEGAVLYAYNTPAGSSKALNFINITQAGTAYCLAIGIQGNNFTLTNSILTSVGYHTYTNLGGGTKGTIIIKNSVLLNGKGLYGLAPSGSSAIGLRWFNSIFKGLDGSNLSDNTRIGWYVEAVRNCIFDSNAKIISKAISGLYGIKNNGYYNNTSEANWTRGPYDETIAATSYSNWTTGTLHSDWTTYGPGDGWKCNTADISTGCDTNSFVGINTSTQSHTGSAETATTQALGLAPVFSAFG